MSIKTIEITIGNRTQMAKEFIDAWHLAETKPEPCAGVEKIYCENEKVFFKLLTPKRFELLKFVHEHGDTSIFSLAKNLNRNYRNVYQDVKELSEVGLLVKDDKTSKYKAPWDAIVTQIPLTRKSHKIPIKPINQSTASSGKRLKKDF